MLYSLLAVSLGAKAPNACFGSLSFAGLVVLARSLNPIPSRTRPLNSSAPMVLWLKPWESRSLPGLPRTKQFLFTCYDQKNAAPLKGRGVFASSCTEPSPAGLTSASLARHHRLFHAACVASPRSKFKITVRNYGVTAK